MVEEGLEMKRAAILAMALLLLGCAGSPTAEETATADYGAMASAVEYKSQIENYFNSNLKDPASIQYKSISPPRKGYVRIANDWVGSSTVYGYMVDATINAKNSYGGYTGFKTYSFLFRDGKLVDVKRGF